MTDETTVAVVRNDDTRRYEIRVGEQRAGFADFSEGDGHIIFSHTEISDAFAGRGLAGELAAQALADAVERHLTIVPLCPYFAAYLKRHDIPGANVAWPEPTRKR